MTAPTPKARRRVSDRAASQHRKPWSDDDKARLAFWWVGTSLETIAKRLGRTEIAVYVYGTQKLKLKTSGYASMETLAVECGVDPKTLAGALKAADVSVKHPPADPTVRRARRSRRRQTLVEPDEARAAIAAYVASETLHGAAVRRGINPPRLKRMAVRAGAFKGAYGRYTDAEIDAVLASRGAA